MATATLDVEIQRVHAVAEAEKAAIAAGDLEAYRMLLADDAVFMPPGASALGGAALRAWLGDFLRNVSVRWEHFAHGETLVSGELAVHPYACSWTATTRATGNAVHFNFKGVHVLRRHSDGSWKIWREMWNLDPA